VIPDRRHHCVWHLMPCLVILAQIPAYAGDSATINREIQGAIERAVASCDKAKAEYDAAVSKQRTMIATRLQAEETKALAAGDLTKVNALQAIRAAIESGDPSSWTAAIQDGAGQAGQVAPGQIKFAGAVYNPGLVARIYRKRVANWTDPALRSQFVFLLRGGDDWTTMMGITQDRMRGKDNEWDPNVLCTGFVVMQRDGTVSIRSVNASITVASGLVTQQGNWEREQSFDYKLAKGAHQIEVKQMNWMTNRLKIEVVAKDSSSPVLYHQPKQLATEVSTVIKLPSGAVPTEFLSAPPTP